ncbi:MAG: glycosyltransferase [Candidatus Latescibacteria bacterium]|nr:glycosyltransferase [Candidatus Latescibacterota bacterium]
MTRPRVAHIIPTDNTAFLMRTRLQRLQEAGFELHILSGDRGYGEQLARAGLEVVHIPFAREIAPWTDLRCSAALYRQLRRGGYHMVHSHNPKGTLLGPPLGQLARVPKVVHTVYGFLFNENSTGLHNLAAKGAERWCAEWTDELIFQSREDYDYARAHDYKKGANLHWVGSGIDERRFDRDLYPQARQQTRQSLGLEPEDLVVGMVGRLVQEKGWGEFFAMAGRLAQQFERARFLIVGINEKGDQSDAVDPAQLMAANDVTQRCIVLEQRTDMPELYLSMDVAVLPSYREGIPRALLEAGAMGTAMAASNIRGCREVIDDGTTGLLFGLKDVDHFSAQIASLLGDSHYRQQLAAAGRSRIMAEFTEFKATQRLAALYQQFLS